MDIATFHASRRFAEVKSGRIAYFERGQGPAALFLHGVPINGYHWRHVIDRVQHRRRCIAIDLMGLGYTEIAPAQDVSFTAQVRMIAEVLDKLGIDKIDLVANDSGGAIAQIFAAHHPHRLTSLVLTNCGVHDGWPPPQVLPLMEHARKGTLAPIFQPTLDHPDLARALRARRVGAAVPQLCRSGRTDRRHHKTVSAAAVVLATTHRRLPALLARLRQCADGSRSFRAENTGSADPDRVRPAGYLLRQEVGPLAEGHHSGRQARRRSRRREIVLPGRPPGCAGRADARILGSMVGSEPSDAGTLADPLREFRDIIAR